MVDWKKVLGYGALILIIIAAVVYFLRLAVTATLGGGEPAVIIKTDTVTTKEYITKTEYRDNVIYKFKYIEKQPEVVYVQKYDSLFLEKIRFKYLEPMLSVSKRRSVIEVFSMSPLDSTIKKYTFKDAGDSFDIYADSGRITMNNSWYEWRGIWATLGADFNVSKKLLRDGQGPFISDRVYKAGIQTGVNLGSSFSLDGGVKYDFMNAETYLNLELNYKLIK